MGKRLSLLVNIHKILQPSDFYISTWLTIGACLQCFLLIFLPKNIALIPPFLFLFYRLIRSHLVATGRLRNPHAESVILDRFTTQFPGSFENEEKPKRSGQTIIVLILAITLSHPAGRLAPGVAKVGKYFADIWTLAEAQRQKYGYLGNSPEMVSQIDAMGKYGRRDGDDRGKTMMWISYWSSLDGLHRFANEGVHREAWKWWEAGASERYQHTGLMHELYEVPAGHWENIYLNFRPFGISNARFPMTKGGTKLGEGNQEEIEFVSGITSTTKKDWKSSRIRMGKGPAGIGQTHSTQS
ncbi:hypothetical protein CC78DRAFT_528656 [Lojkania enalia]|uniref:Monooxygenase n=1 Tax=Lojkania enalia TaxID=147567 RepID=A0A9P4NBK9_9PLEO|nr:hypothetical protein CC78DRAFT_528656 [Didymosphaeria enalia]